MYNIYIYIYIYISYRISICFCIESERVIHDIYPDLPFVVQSYLKKFGYLNNDAATEISDIDMEEAILRFQDMASVEKTG